MLSTIDDLSRLDSPIHRLHPLAKLLATLLFITAAASFDRRAAAPLLPLALYPAVLLSFSGLPAGFILKRTLAVQPAVLLIGLFSPLAERDMVQWLGFTFSAGWLTMLSLLLRGLLIVSASLVFIASTGMVSLGTALLALHVPKIFVLQLLLTYRYITVLTGEASRLWLAYSLRAPGQRGVKARAWGPLAGQLLLRSFSKAERVHTAMELRGFDGTFVTGKERRLRAGDWVFLAVCAGYAALVRLANLPQLLGDLILN